MTSLTKQYVVFTIDEFLSLLTTSFFAGFILTFNDWGTTTLDIPSGVKNFLLMFISLFFVFLVTVWVCKVIAIKFGYTLNYRHHLAGLLIGLFFCVLSRGYFPLFLPGGFLLQQHERLHLGRFRNYYKGWEIGVITATFPLVLLLWILLLNPFYLATQSPTLLLFTSGISLAALFSCIPLPFFENNASGRAIDIFRYLRGSTFGLDVYYSSGAWYVVLCCTVLFFVSIAYLLTVMNISVGIFLYAVSFLVGLLGLWVYSNFFKK